MSRYIDADLILYKTVAYPVFDFATGMVHTELLEGEYAKREEIEAVPTADVQEVVHAKFELINSGKGVCNNCHKLDSIDNIAKYCRYCGARMDDDKK